MGEATKIEWAHHTWNPWRGCAHAKLPDGSEHPGCLNCYAEAGSERNPKSLGTWGKDGTRAIGVETYWNLPHRWNRAAKKAGERHRVFFASFADVFEDREDLIPHRNRAFEIIDRCPHLDFLVLTKRPQNIRRMWKGVSSAVTTPDINYTTTKWVNEPFPFRSNVWILTSVSDQATADAMVPELLKCRDLSPVLGMSCEPLLGPVHLMGWRNIHDNGPCPACHDACETTRGLDWVIVGGESGHGARPCNVEWVRSLRDQCAAAAVACFTKQLGANIRCCEAIDPLDQWPEPCPRFTGLTYDTIRVHLRNAKGGDWEEWPEDLRVRQFPEVVHA